MMPELSTLFLALGSIALLLTLIWVISVRIRDASVVDPFWSWAFGVALFVYLTRSEGDATRRLLIVSCVLLWAVRLSAHLFARRRHETGEDRRYAKMRENAGDRFAMRSLVTIFWLQAVLAWIISWPLLAATSGTTPVWLVDWLGVVLFGIGLFWQTVADAQLARFKQDPANRGRVMSRGLWRYSRHPNYFGEMCVWWGITLLAIAAGGWWCLPGPLLLSFLLARVSGVPMLEVDIAKRRPGYAEYTRSTNALFPWKPR